MRVGSADFLAPQLGAVGVREQVVKGGSVGSLKLYVPVVPCLFDLPACGLVCRNQEGRRHGTDTQDS